MVEVKKGIKRRGNNRYKGTAREVGGKSRWKAGHRKAKHQTARCQVRARLKSVSW